MNFANPAELDALTRELPELIGHPVLLPALFDYGATFIWALSGALIAARRGYVGIGIMMIALVSRRCSPCSPARRICTRPGRPSSPSQPFRSSTW